MVMTIRKSGKWIGALGMPVSLVHQIKELVGNTYFLIFDMRLAEGTRIYLTCLGQLGTSKRISQPSKLIFFRNGHLATTDFGKVAKKNTKMLLSVNVSAEKCE